MRRIQPLSHHRTFMILMVLMAAGLTALMQCTAAPSPTNVLHVYAASSLTECFGEIEADFEAAHPEIDVRLTFAGSQTLRMQIEHGAPAQVFASANARHLDTLAHKGLVDRSEGFAQNGLALVAPSDNPLKITGFQDLPRVKNLVLGIAASPIGEYTDALLRRADSVLGMGFSGDVRARIVSREVNTRLVLAKVILGAVDAAIVYRTDALSTDAVVSFEPPSALTVEIQYQQGLIRRPVVSEPAELWMAYVLSDEGVSTLVAHGFGAP